MIINCNIFKKLILDKGVDWGDFYKKRDFLSIRFGNLSRNLHLPFFQNLNKNLVTDDEKIIIFDGGVFDKHLLTFIESKFSNKKLIFYYWNPVSCSIDPRCIPSNFEKWSYSLTDCQKYGLKFNPTFYFDDLVDKSCFSLDQDVFFIGKDKGRYAELINFEKLFIEKGLSTKFIITANHSISLRKKYSKSISYKEVLENVKRSKCLFDFYSDSLAGLSLRAMESLFFGKKLITNNKTIREYDFFHPENIFILGERDLIELKNFVCSEYLPISKDVKKKYLFSEWLKRFN